MAFDGKWVSIPLATSQVRDKPQHKLSPLEARTLFDVDSEQARGTWTMRRGHKRLFELPGTNRNVRAISEYVRDGISRICALIAANETDTTVYAYERKSDGSDGWHLAQTDPAIFNTGIASIETVPNELRVFGSGMIWRGNVRAVSMRRFNTSTGPLTANPVTEVNTLAINKDLIEVTGELSIGHTRGYSHLSIVQYYCTFVYEGQQESNFDPTTPSLEIQASETGGESSGYWIQLTVKVASPSDFPKRVKAIRIYRTWRKGLYEGDKELRLVKTIPIYKTDENSWGEWTLNSDGSFDTEFTDRFSAVQRFVDVTARPVIVSDKIHDEPDPNRRPGRRERPAQSDVGYLKTQLLIDPNRRRARIFSDRAFYWGLTDDTGTETFNRLYYSHYSAQGIHCPDIVLPANYIEFPFNIMDVIEAGTHRIVIGDIGFAVGYMRGSVKDQWQIYQGRTRVGCLSEKSIAETPFGAVFLGYDGIYVIASLQYQGPYGVGIFRDIESHPNLANAIGGYSQQGMRYYLYIPGESEAGRKTVAAKFYCMDLNTQDKRVRELSTPETDEIQAFGFGIDGTALFATEDGIFRAEELAGQTDFSQTPLPEIETGLIRFIQGDNLQQLHAVALDYDLVGANIRLSIKSYPLGSETELSALVPESNGGTIAVFPLPAETPKDMFHAIRIRTVTDDTSKQPKHPSVFVINELQALVQLGDGTI